jgi:hypothetical protein
MNELNNWLYCNHEDREAFIIGWKSVSQNDCKPHKLNPALPINLPVILPVRNKALLRCVVLVSL